MRMLHVPPKTVTFSEHSCILACVGEAACLHVCDVLSWVSRANVWSLVHVLLWSRVPRRQRQAAEGSPATGRHARLDKALLRGLQIHHSAQNSFVSTSF